MYSSLLFLGVSLFALLRALTAGCSPYRTWVQICHENISNRVSSMVFRKLELHSWFKSIAITSSLRHFSFPPWKLVSSFSWMKRVNREPHVSALDSLSLGRPYFGYGVVNKDTHMKTLSQASAFHRQVPSTLVADALAIKAAVIAVPIAGFRAITSCSLSLSCHVW
ncbi:hypothetical protein AALP_AA8G314100 [Arabis alpina]|uniref:Secreted protein n=1 Tax=Arabis alpina TaxID=50452 RepID=A0A087GAP2_ARAAL|nr:hypothetical protein AALP_AA8G314100 [Arabis alpina]